MSELQGIARFRFYEGKVDEFKRLSAECSKAVRAKDTGTLQYEIFLNENEAECIVLERYRDSEALMEHMSNLGDLADAILATGEVTGELLGQPSTALRTGLAGGPVRLYVPFASM